MEQLLSQGMFEPKATPGADRRRWSGSETLLALIEGWVQTVVTAALGDRIPGHGGAERRCCAAGAAPAGPPSRPSRRWSGWSCGPASCARPRRCGSGSPRPLGADARDAVWQHPDLLPGAEDLDEPAGFIDRIIGGDTSGIDQAIADLRSPRIEEPTDKGGDRAEA